MIRKRNPLSEETKLKISKAQKGRVVSLEKRLKISKTLKGRDLGENASAWKGDNVGYTALHKWVSKNLGFPNKCEHCGIINNSHYKIQWANKDHQYKRNLKDWLRLCAPCHRKYDKYILLVKKY